MQEIALVLGAVFRLQQLEEAVDFAHLGVMAGRDAVGAHRQRVFQE